MTGGDEGDRTPDLGVANAALSHLSYIPTSRKNNSTPIPAEDSGVKNKSDFCRISMISRMNKSYHLSGCPAG